jgi:hypothetical protein
MQRRFWRTKEPSVHLEAGSGKVPLGSRRLVIADAEQ